MKQKMEKSTMKRNTDKRNGQEKSAKAILQFEMVLGLIYRLNIILQVLLITNSRIVGHFENQ